MIVYKYLPPTGIRVLNGLIRFTRSTALNDPFETTPNMKRLEESFREYALRTIEGAKYRSIIEYVSDRSRVSSLIKKHFDEFRRTITNNYAVLSLSKINNNLLMWAHYCDSHRGFVLGFDSKDPFFQTRRVKAFSTLAEVHYSDERPMMPAPEKWDGSREQVLESVGSEDLAELFFYTKSTDWAYEQELRMVANPRVASHRDKKSVGQDVYLYKFPLACLKQVIFGIRMPSDERLKISNLVRDSYEGVQLSEAMLSEEKFDLNISPLK